MTALPRIKLTSMPWGVISAGGGDHHPHPCGLGLNLDYCDILEVNCISENNGEKY